MQKSFLRNVCLCTNFILLLKNKTKKWDIFKTTWKNNCVTIRKRWTNNFHIWELHDKRLFFQKTKSKNLCLFITRLFFLESNSCRNYFTSFSIIFENCIKKYENFMPSVFLTLDVWNCIVRIFGVWRSTRESDRRFFNFFEIIQSGLKNLDDHQIGRRPPNCNKTELGRYTIVNLDNKNWTNYFFCSELSYKKRKKEYDYRTDQNFYFNLLLNQKRKK